MSTDAPTAKCRECQKPFIQSRYQVRKNERLCKPCRRIHDAEWRELRRSAGLPTGGRHKDLIKKSKRMKSYCSRREVKIRQAELAKERYYRPDLEMKNLARRETRNALRRGDLVRCSCEVCGSQNAEAHHDDYAKPLEVRWLCRRHHEEQHHGAGPHSLYSQLEATREG